MKILLTLAAVLALGAGLAQADIIDWTLSTQQIMPEAVDASIYVTPGQTGVPLTAAFAPGGSVVDATITATLVDPMGDLVEGYPREDMWLESADGGLAACLGGTWPDADSDVNGDVFWTQPLAAGGHTTGAGIHVYVGGAPLVGPGLPLTVNSADIDGDLQVNLTDVALFTQALGTGTYAADFTNDGIVNLSDIALFVPGLGTSCD
jgi:hypothetical protein